MATRDEIIAEIERRQALASTGGAPTATTPSPQGGSPAPAPQGFVPREARVQEGGEWHDAPRAALRGMTMGLSDAAGSAVAALPAGLAKGWNPQSEEAGFKETYEDIRDVTQIQEDDYAERDPTTKGFLEAGGAVASIAASGLPRAVGGALKRGAARVGGGAAKQSSGHSTLGAAFKRAGGGGKPAKAASPGRLATARDNLIGGAELDAAQYMLSGDTDPGFTAAGAAAGFLFPKWMRETGKLATRNPLGRLLTSRLAGKVLGSKAKPYVWTTTHPATVSDINKAKQAAAEWAKKRRGR